MKVVVQRVKKASCVVDGNIVGKIQQGFLLLVSFTHQDTNEDVLKMVNKIIKLRIFSDENGKMNLSIDQVGGSILSISQFTLYASLKGLNRPSFTESLGALEANKLYEYFNTELAKYIHVEKGIFGADMQIELINDGPVTIIIDTKEI